MPAGAVAPSAHDVSATTALSAVAALVPAGLLARLQGVFRWLQVAARGLDILTYMIKINDLIYHI